MLSLRHLPPIFAAAVLVFACAPDQWQKDPLPVCEEGTKNCGKASTPKPTKSAESKGPSGLPESADPSSTNKTESTEQEEEEETDPDPAPAKDAGSTPPKDAGPPPKGPTCLSPANACFAVTEKCGCAEDCCAGTVCAQVGGLVQNTCCKQAAAPCATHSDCCGQLLCKADAMTGGNTCQ